MIGIPWRRTNGFSRWAVALALGLVASCLTAAPLCGAEPPAASPDQPAKNPGAARERKIVLIAGQKSHGPGAHDYERTMRLFKVALDNSHVPAVRTEVHEQGWPKDPATLEDADLIVFYSDGRDGNLFVDVPFVLGDRLKVIERQMRRGCGLMTFHFSTFVTDQQGEQVLDWLGGYFDWQDDQGQRNWFSRINQGPTLELASPSHPISRGVARAIPVNDEVYWKMRFRPGDTRLTPIWRVPEYKDPDQTPNANVVAWTVERTDGGRGFSTSVGHSYRLWEIDDVRRLFMNALVWTAGADVPEDGVKTRFYSDEQVNAALQGVVGTQRALVKNADGVNAPPAPPRPPPPRPFSREGEKAEAAAGPSAPATGPPAGAPAPAPTPAPGSPPVAVPPKAPPSAAAVPPAPNWKEVRDKLMGIRWTEKDGLDDRWQQTQVGQFLASVLPLPTGTVAKGLSIRLPGDKAAVGFDTAQLKLRAGWMGGFLAFQPERYGLIKSPRPAGEFAFSASPGAGWSGGPARWGGLRRQGAHTLLEYTVAETPVREHFQLERHHDRAAFSRTLELGPTTSELTLHVLDGPHARVADVRGLEIGQIDVEERVVAVVLQSASALHLESAKDRDLQVVFPPDNQPRRLRILLWSGDSEQLGTLVDLAESLAPPAALEGWATPGPRVWGEPLVTRGERAADTAPLVVDTLTLPFDNPFNALLFCSGNDFFSNGDVAVCTVHGDVWRVTGVDAQLNELRWRRYATGLFQPLGLKVIDDRVHVLGRDQITRLHDLNSDGEADYYENVSNVFDTSTGGHDYSACLETDSAGNFYFVHAKQGVVRVSADGRTSQTIATGLRNPNGLGLGPQDFVTAAPQEGNWTPASGIFWVREAGDHFGFGGPRVTPRRPLGYDPPLCWIPRPSDNSSGGEVWVPTNTWGRLADHMLHLSFGQSQPLLVLRESFDDRWQGATVVLPVRFQSGAIRGRFHPKDGSLFVTGLRGWQTNATRDGCLQRVRWTGLPFNQPVAFHTHANGLAIEFSDPLERGSAEDVDNYHVQRWNYHYREQYGSPDYSVTHPQREGRDEVNVLSASLLADGRTVFLELEGLAPVMQLGLEYSLLAGSGARLQQSVNFTLHHVPAHAFDENQLTGRARAALARRDLSKWRPGLTWRVGQPGAATTLDEIRRTRLAAWTTQDAPRHARKDTPPASAVAEGLLVVPLPGEHAFQLDGRGTVSLSINGEPVLNARGDLSQAAPVTVRLRRQNPVRLEFAPLDDQQGHVRLLWSSESFAPEPVPPTAWFSPPDDVALIAAERAERARELLSEHRCLRCHSLPKGARPVPELARAAPRLDGLHGRYRPEWLRRWISHPQQLRPEASMPRLITDDAVGSRELADLVAYLSSPVPLSTVNPVRDEAGTAPAVTPPAETSEAAAQATAALVARGLTLYEDLNCMACHRLTAPELSDEFQRVSLYWTRAKFEEPALVDYLRQPHKHFNWNPMPDFRLNDEESRALSAFLSAETAPAAEQLTADTRPPTVEGDVPRGAIAFQTLGCSACHSDPAPQVAWTRDWGTAGPAAGCLAEHGTPVPVRLSRAEGDVATVAVLPRFELPDVDRTTLQAAWKSDPRELTFRSASQCSASLMRELRCAACHDRDGMRSPRGEILSEESRTGRLPEVLPSLTWTGEKLRSQWLESVLRGAAPPARPGMKARMPAFPAFAPLLAQGLAAEHAVSTETSPPNQPDPELVEVGRGLTFKTGLDCRQCHAVGHERPTGDAQSTIAEGVNFSLIRERLRPEFYQRFMLDPPRWDIGIKMPRLAPDGRTTGVTGVFGGDAARQFDAIWNYLQTVEPWSPDMAGRR